MLFLRRTVSCRSYDHKAYEQGQERSRIAHSLPPSVALERSWHLLVSVVFAKQVLRRYAPQHFRHPPRRRTLTPVTLIRPGTENGGRSGSSSPYRTKDCTRPPWSVYPHQCPSELTSQSCCPQRRHGSLHSCDHPDQQAECSRSPEDRSSYPRGFLTFS